jgi:hypothetical protein
LLNPAAPQPALTPRLHFSRIPPLRLPLVIVAGLDAVRSIFPSLLLAALLQLFALLAAIAHGASYFTPKLAIASDSFE